jgi:hypothetical protein
MASILNVHCPAVTVDRLAVCVDVGNALLVNQYISAATPALDRVTANFSSAVSGKTFEGIPVGNAPMINSRLSVMSLMVFNVT